MNKFDNTSINLEILAEECAEVIQVKSKIVRFGIDDQHPTYPSNRARLEEELGHLIAMKDILVNQGVISDKAIEGGRQHKLDKLAKWYPKEFSEEKAINRNVEAERKLLEKPTSKLNADVHESLYCQGLKTVQKALLENFNEVYKDSGPAPKLSKRGQDWVEFSNKVLTHIEQYTVPQYGDKGNDQITEWSIKDCLKAVNKRIARYGRQSREGQQELDFLKMVHEVQIAWDKYITQLGSEAEQEMRDTANEAH